MQFSKPNSIIAHTHPSHAFELPPSASAVRFPQPFDVSDPGADRYGFNVNDFANDLKVHSYERSSSSPNLLSDGRPLTPRIFG